MVAILEECKIVCSPSPDTRASVLCFARVRSQFYNYERFAYAPQVVEAALANYRLPQVRRFTWTDAVLNFMIVLAAGTILLYVLPGMWNRLIPGHSLSRESQVIEETVQSLVSATAVGDGEKLTEAWNLPEGWQRGSHESSDAHRVAPEYDLSLPEGRWVVNKDIGLQAPIYTNESVENVAEADALLERGIYMYPQYDSIGWSGREVILAGHHYNMTISDQKAAQSFQNLNKLQVGDKVQIVDDYKIWTYEIYKIEESTEITEENPDLMMYTCIYWWDAKLRLFVYARIVE